jgi:hypothetical protein
MKRGILILVVGLMLHGCASTMDNLQRESARSIGDVLPEAVTVKSVDRGASSVKWEADSPKGTYSCSADDMLRRVYCVKR